METTIKKVKKEKLKKTKKITKKVTHKEKIKKSTPKKEVKKEVVKISPKPEKYYEAIGRRKTSIARVRLFSKGEKLFLVNTKPIEKYFPTFELQEIAKSPLEKMKCLDKFGISARIKGGGLVSQAGAIRHAISRALVLFNPDFRKRLKKAGFLKRDPRMKERKKFGLKRARKAPQWQKR
jgi:small subunit ribosomal protein S9